MPKPYQLVQRSEEKYELIAFGDIGESYWEETLSAKEVVSQLANVSAKEIVLRINSFGGSVADGLAIYNALQSHGAKIVTQNEGVAVSIAGYLFMAGSERKAYQNSLYMLHAPMSTSYGNSKQLRDQADVLDKFSEAEISTFTQKTSLDEEAVRQLLTDGEDHWYTASEALDMGFVTEIIEEDVVVDASFLTSQFLKNAPSQVLQSLAPKGAKKITASDKSSVPAEPNLTQKEAIMPDEVTSSANPVEQNINVEDIQQKTIAEYKARSASIKQAVSAASLDQSFADDLINQDVSVDAAREKILQKLSESQATIDPSQRVKFNSGSEESFRQEVIAGVSARAGVEGFNVNQFSRYGFKDLARTCLEQSGVSTAQMSSDQILQSAITHSTGDFANIFENVMHKTMLGQFRAAPHVWRRFCGTGDLSDFRAHNRYRPGSFGDLKGLQENGEFKQISIGDAEKETISANSKGVIFNLSFEMLKNDDMGAFMSVARGLGRSAARSLENDFFALLASNPIMQDGAALFHADHGNFPSGAAISMAALDASRVLMRKQKDPSDNEFLDINPALLLCPVELGGLARQTIASETDPSQSNSKKPNIVRDMAEIVDTPRLTGTAWYLFADPRDVPAIEVGFLDGVQEPEIITQDNFNSRGISYRVAFDYGMAAIESRAALKNVGA